MKRATRKITTNLPKSRAAKMEGQKARLASGKGKRGPSGTKGVQGPAKRKVKGRA